MILNDAGAANRSCGSATRSRRRHFRQPPDRKPDSGFANCSKGIHSVCPHSRPMPVVGPRCHELRVRDAGATWRIVYRVDADAIVIAAVFSKKTRTTPKAVIATCKQRLRSYDDA